eukprot:s9099_g2.t1
MNSAGPGTMDLRGPGPMPGPMNSMGPGTMDLRGLMPGPMDSMGPGTMDLRGPSPMASRAPNSPFSSVRGPPMTMVPAPAPLPPPATATARQPMSPEQYAVVQKELHECLDAALMKRKELVQSLDQVTNSQSPAVGTQVTVSRYDQPMSKAAAHNLDQVDWRVPRLMYCLDPKYNTVLDPAIAFEVQQKKSEDGASAGLEGEVADSFVRRSVSEASKSPADGKWHPPNSFLEPKPRSAKPGPKL